MAGCTAKFNLRTRKLETMIKKEIGSVFRRKLEQNPNPQKDMFYLQLSGEFCERFVIMMSPKGTILYFTDVYIDMISLQKI